MEEKQALRSGTPQDYGGTVAFQKGEEDDSGKVVLQEGQAVPATNTHAARSVLTDEVRFEKDGDSGTIVFTQGNEGKPSISYAGPHQEKLNGRSSAYGAVFIVINAAFGAGLLAFPYAFFLAGGKSTVVGGIISEAVSYLLFVYSCRHIQELPSPFLFMQGLVPFCVAGLTILAYCSELTQSCTYEMMMEKMWGTWARVITEICIAIYCFGACVTYLVVIGNQFEDSE